MKRRGFTPSPTGITLVEILVALAILGMIALALYGILKGGLDVWRGGKERTDAIAQARVAMDRLTREVREATYMVSASDTMLRFSAYLLGTAAADYKDISYYYDSASGILYRHNVTDDIQAEMAYFVTDFDFDYYSKGDDGAIHSFSPGYGTYDDIWMIAIDAQVTRGPTGEQNVVNLRSTVQPRNYSEYHVW